MGEARQALEAMDWEGAEQICGKKLEGTFAILFKLFDSAQGTWREKEERVLLYFIDKEQESLKRLQNDL